MTRFSTFAAAAALMLAGATAADAQGWSRNSSTTGPNGGKWSSSGSGSCAGGTCSSSQKATGPHGNSVTRNGATSCANGKCSGTATYSGPRGNTATRTRSITRN
jgi:hypothetical protein